MAEKSSVTNKIVVGLFVVVVFPVGAFLLQRYLGGQPEQDQGQKQSQTQKVEITINNNPPAPVPDRGVAALKREEPETGSKHVEPKAKTALKDVTLSALNENPEKFDGQTLTIRGELSGNLRHGVAARYRLTVKDSAITLLGEELRKKGINFEIAKEEKEKLLGGFEPTKFYPVRLTVTVYQGGKGPWFATVTKIEREASLLALSSTPEKFGGQTLTVSGELSGTLHDGNAARSRLTIKDGGVAIYGDKPTANGINFFVSKSQKERLVAGLQSDRFYPVLVTVTVSQEANGRWVAVVSEIEQRDR